MTAPDALTPRSKTAGTSGSLSGVAARVGALTGYRRAGLALLLGVLSAAAMPPFNLLPLLLPGFTVLLWLVDGARSRGAAFRDGWFWGLGFFVPNLYWIANALVVDIGRFWWLVPMVVLGVPAIEALHTGVATLVFRATPGKGAGRILVFAAVWVAIEWLRGRAPFGGFPWALIGDGWSGNAPLLVDGLQLASLLGVYGLSFLTVLVAALPALAGESALSARPFRERTLPIASGAALLAASLGWGAARLGAGADPVLPGVTLRLIQTNTPDAVTSSDEAARARLETVMTLADGPGIDRVRAEIWPEGSSDFLVNRDPPVVAAIARHAPPGGIVFTGTVRANPEGPIDAVWNSVAVVTSAGELLRVYDKAHLVPFGEYIPLRSVLGFIPLVAGHPGLATGPGPVTLDLPSLPPVAPIICYEAMFPHAIIDESRRPGWILNVSDDAWFGHSIGPAQLFAEGRLRAVEEGLPLARAANGGLSGMIDGHGRLLASLPLGITGILDVPLPERLARPTAYARYGDRLPLALILGAALLGAALIRQARRRES
jgi:apolipoprotein N-acyltransferase